MNGKKGTLRVHSGDNGILKAIPDRDRELLGRFLEEDVQESSSHCLELLNAIEGISSQGEQRWEQTGNAHTVILDRSGVTIESEMDEECAPLHLSLDEFEEAVKTWLSAIEHGGDAS